VAVEQDVNYEMPLSHKQVWSGQPATITTTF